MGYIEERRREEDRAKYESHRYRYDELSECLR